MKKESSLSQKLKEDIHHIHKDWEKLLSQKALASDQVFLSSMAKHIKTLNEDCMAAKQMPELEKTASLIQHLIATPVGAPFVTEKTMLEAAMIFHSQKPTVSDLSDILKHMVKYTPKINNQLLLIFDSFEDQLKI